jgi:hypothetical protein
MIFQMTRETDDKTAYQSHYPLFSAQAIVGCAVVSAGDCHVSTGENQTRRLEYISSKIPNRRFEK